MDGVKTGQRVDVSAAFSDHFVGWQRINYLIFISLESIYNSILRTMEDRCEYLARLEFEDL